jgi:hypothetical protein
MDSVTINLSDMSRGRDALVHKTTNHYRSHIEASNSTLTWPIPKVTIHCLGLQHAFGGILQSALLLHPKAEVKNAIVRRMVDLRTCMAG